ncbi:MAG: O-antigen ligase domain-containing protein [Alphaproteobacteria bacterium]|nr:O-antigen ligase domain-containing protein [Alphaproteobacteria bacterium]
MSQIKSIQAIKRYSSQQVLWSIAYLFTLLLPLGLIFSRGFAEVCVAMVGLSWLLHSAANKNWLWLYDPIAKIGGVAWGWLLFSSFFADNALDSFAVAVPWIRYILLFMALKEWVLTSKKSLMFIAKFLLFVVCLVIVDVIWQYIFGISLTGNLRDSSGRLTGPINNVKVGIFTAKMLLPAIGIYFFFAIQEKSIFRIIFSAFVLMSGISMIMITGERTAFASTIIGISCSAILLSVSMPKIRKYVALIALLIAVGAQFLFVTQDWVRDRASGAYLIVSNYPQTNYGKLAIAGYLIGKEHFLVGAGLKGFRELCPSLIKEGKADYCNLHPHNPYMEWFASAGAIGLVLFMSMVGGIAYICVKQFMLQKGTMKLLPALSLATIIANFFPFMPTQSIFSNWPAILLWYSVSLAVASLNVLPKTNRN